MYHNYRLRTSVLRGSDRYALFVLLAINIVVLGSIFVLLIFEEWRYRKFRRHFLSVREHLLSIVHQLRSPLTSLRKYGHMLQQRELGPVSVAQAEALSRMEHAREDMMHGLNRFLAASKLEEGSISVQPADVGIRDAVDAAFESIATHVDERKLDVGMHGDRRLSLFIDPLLLHGILDELLQNAAVYTPAKGSVDVSFSRKGRNMQIAIRDTGIGISDEERSHVFEKFFRGERARAMHEGNGLGLYFAKQFAETLGGSLSFASRVDQGSQFTLTLPLRRR